MKCKRCGTVHVKERKVCYFCGSLLIVGRSVAISRTNASRKRKYKLYIAGLIISLLLIMVGYALFIDHPTESVIPITSRDQQKVSTFVEPPEVIEVAPAPIEKSNDQAEQNPLQVIQFTTVFGETVYPNRSDIIVSRNQEIYSLTTTEEGYDVSGLTDGEYWLMAYVEHEGKLYQSNLECIAIENGKVLSLEDTLHSNTVVMDEAIPIARIDDYAVSIVGQDNLWASLYDHNGRYFCDLPTGPLGEIYLNTDKLPDGAYDLYVGVMDNSFYINSDFIWFKVADGDIVTPLDEIALKLLQVTCRIQYGNDTNINNSDLFQYMLYREGRLVEGKITNTSARFGGLEDGTYTIKVKPDDPQLKVEIEPQTFIIEDGIASSSELEFEALGVEE